MQVAQYIFQSPSSSPVQVGKLDTSAQQEQATESMIKNSNTTAKKAESFTATQIKSVTPTVNSNKSLDVYA